MDYESLGKLGSIMGSGGMVVMDDDNCMVDVARYFIEFTRSESCGKCTPCRVGLDKALRTLTRITKGEGREEDLAELDELGRMIRDTSLCGLGQSGPNSVLTALRHFRHEFEDHIRAKRCRAGVCQDLAVAPCENSCPLHMNIPRFLQLYQEDRLADAFESVIMDNPLPASTGRVCQHPCDSRCRRRTVDEPVNMREVHRVIADSVLLSDHFDEAVGRILDKRLAPPLRSVPGRCGRGGSAAGNRGPARPRRSRGLSGTLAHDAQPRGVAGETPVDRVLHGLQRLKSGRDAARAGDRLHPDAAHLRAYLAVTVGAHAAAGAVAQVLGAVHRAGHARGAQDALSAHAAVKERALHAALESGHRALQTRIADAPPQGVQRDQHGLEAAVEGREPARVADGPFACGVHGAIRGSS